MSRKRINLGEEWYSRETNEEKRACTSNAESFMVIMEADDSVSRPRCVVAGTSSSEAPNQDLEENKVLYEIKEKFRLYARRCWDDYWKMVLQIILNGKTPTVSFNEMYKDLYRSICQLETEPPKTTYAKDPTQISLRSWFLLNPFLPEHTEEDVVICHFWLHTKGTLSIMEQRNDAGVNAECVLSKRLRMLKEQGKCHIVGVMELICSWSFCKRCIKRVADEIKRVHPGVTKIIFRTRSVTSVTSLFGVEVHPFKSDCWKEMRKYLTDEGSSYIGNDDPSVSQIADFLNTRATNTFSSVVHGRVMPLKTWFLFNEQLRTCNVRYITCIVCCVTFSSSTVPFCLHQTNETRDVHAEAVTLMRLEAMQAEAKDRNDSIRCIRIYSTYSPCPSCISRYCVFLEGMPELEELHLIFSCIYLSNEPQVNAELQAFEKKFRQKVKVEAFNDEYWEALKEHLSEEGVKDLENKSKNFEVSRPLFSNWGQSPATTPKKVKN